MGVVADFMQKHRHKQIDFERKMLRELSIKNIEEVIDDYFDPFLKPMAVYRATIADMCLDYAIESYLLGGSFGRFGYYDGESFDLVFERSRGRFATLRDDLYDFWMFWFHADDMSFESVYMACDGFLYYWWKEGFENTVRRYRMRLH